MSSHTLDSNAFPLLFARHPFAKARESQASTGTERRGDTNACVHIPIPFIEMIGGTSEGLWLFCASSAALLSLVVFVRFEFFGFLVNLRREVASGGCFS